MSYIVYSIAGVYCLVAVGFLVCYSQSRDLACLVLSVILAAAVVCALVLAAWWPLAVGGVVTLAMFVLHSGDRLRFR